MGLVHRAIRPDNILLITESNESEFLRNVGTPYLIGFNGSRGEKQRSGNTDFRTYQLFRRAYCHPDFLVPSTSRADFSILEDIYSFGVVLLEILTWKPVVWPQPINGGRDRHWSPSEHCPQSDAATPQEWTAAYKMEADKLGREVSRILGDIVTYCLKRAEIVQKNGFSRQAIAFLRIVTLSLKEAAEALGQPLKVW